MAHTGSTFSLDGAHPTGWIGGCCFPLPAWHSNNGILVFLRLLGIGFWGSHGVDVLLHRV